MLLESILIGAAGNIWYNVNKSIELDEQAKAKYAKAFTKEAEADRLVTQKKFYTDKRVENVVKKKRAIIDVSIPMFVNVYEQIQKINIERKDEKNNAIECTWLQKQNFLTAISIIPKKDFTEKELVLGSIIKGIPAMWVEESKRNLSAARSQMSAANVAYSQAKSMADLYDAISLRADRIAKLLSHMNALFIDSIIETGKTIERNGFDIKNYNESEKATVMMCVNIAVAMTKLIDIPVIDENGNITEAAIDMLAAGEKSLMEINELINQ